MKINNFIFYANSLKIHNEMSYDFMCFSSTINCSRPALSPTNNINSGIFRNPAFVNWPWSLDLSKDIMFYKLVYFLIIQSGDITLGILM